VSIVRGTNLVRRGERKAARGSCLAAEKIAFSMVEETS
jgi:hypothetical protein